MLQEKRIYDYWNVDADRSLSDSWKGFSKFTLLEEKPPKGYLWSGGRLTKNFSNHQTREYVALKYGPKLEKPLRGKKSNNGQTRSQNSTMLEG